LIPKEEMKIIERKFKELQKVFNDMENSKPQIFLYVSKEYSASKLPGCLTVKRLKKLNNLLGKIPFNFKYLEMVEFYQQNKDEIIEIRESYKSLIQRIEVLRKNIIENLKLSRFSMPKTTDREVLESILLVLKQIEKFFIGNQSKKLESIEILQNIDKLELSQDNTLKVPLKLSEQSLNNLLKT